MKKLEQCEQGRVTEYLKNLHNIYGVDIIMTVCCVCGEQMGVKIGEGSYGVSHSYCPACLMAATSARSSKPAIAQCE